MIIPKPPPERKLTKAEKKANKREADELGRKLVEEEYLGHFIEAYRYSLGEKLEYGFSRCERPDFICERPNGEMVGVELTHVVGDTWNLNTSGDPEEYADGFWVLDRAYELIQKKDQKRGEPDWKLSDNTILVIQLKDYSFREGDGHVLSCTEPEDFKNHGFKEIFLGDYSGLDAYGDIELFCLYPENLWGYYERWNPGRKPYG